MRTGTTDRQAINDAASTRLPLAPGMVLGRIGALEVRLARDEADIAAAQRLRHEVFFSGPAATAGTRPDAETRDRDRHDEMCDHLLVVDNSSGSGGNAPIVGTYRLLRAASLAPGDSFYSAGEFDLEPLLRRHEEMNFLELGRSCVLPAYRGRRTIELLWQGIWAYVRHHGVDVMVGCASFPGTVPAAHAHALSFLHHHARATDEWAVSALPRRRSCMDMMPAEALDARAAIAAMPPLVKGYLRLGARVGDGCVVDRAFGTTDVLVILPVAAICQRYIDHYGADAERFAA